MKLFKVLISVNIFLFFSAISLAKIDCPADYAYYPVMDTTSTSYGDTVATGLCACLGFGETINLTDSTLTLSIHVFNNEPLKAFQFEVIDNTSEALKINSVTVGEKIKSWMVPFNETARGTALLFGFSMAGDFMEAGTEGLLVDITFDIQGSLGEEVSFYFGGEGGVRLSDVDAQNVACSYPDAMNPISYPISGVYVDSDYGEIPQEYTLKQNFPNPFNPITTIEFSLPEQTQVQLTIFNVLGQRIITLIDGNMEAGYHKVRWRGRDQYGKRVSSGIYIYSLRAKDYFDQKKMLLVQ